MKKKKKTKEDWFDTHVIVDCSDKASNKKIKSLIKQKVLKEWYDSYEK
jgi:hypothetical protein|tara:strand:- start:132 stop:275 length:144 start_codon:yes stop_codon:yes gene_type:complete